MIEISTLIGIAIFAYILWSHYKPKPASDYWSDAMCEEFAREYGWIAEAEDSGNAGVLHPATGERSASWRAACNRMGEKFGKRTP